MKAKRVSEGVSTSRSSSGCAEFFLMNGTDLFERPEKRQPNGIAGSQVILALVSCHQMFVLG